MNTQKGTADSSIVQAALTRLGDPYSKAKRGTGDYVDCSYLAKWAYEQVGIALPSTSAAQAKYCHDNGYEISKSELQPGDLVFWSDTSCSCGRWNEIHHVAIYAGNNKVIEAKPSTGEVVLDRIWGENGSDWKIVMYARPQRKSGA
ncbi:MAG: C40 family peptidase [Bacillota bacterium]